MPNEVTAARCDGSIYAKIRSADHLVSSDRELGKPSNAQKRLQPLNSFAAMIPAPRPEFRRIDRKRASLFAVQQRGRRLQRLHAASLGNFPGDHQAKCDRQPDARGRSTEQQPQGAGYGRIQLRHRHTHMDRPSFGAGQDAMDGFNIHALTRLGSRRIRADARNGFLHGRCLSHPHWRVFVSGVRATIFSLASMTVPAHPAGSPACAEDRADLVRQQSDCQYVAEFTVPE